MTRLISGVALLVAVIGALWFLPPVALLAIAVLVALLAFREYQQIAERTGIFVSTPAGALAVALTCVAAGMPGLPVEAAIASATLGLSALVLVRATKEAASGGQALQAAAIAAFAPLYIGLPLGLLSATRWVLGREAALLLIVTVALSDTFQYYCGRAFGRRPLAPTISPKKTIEGAIGGAVFGTAAMVAGGLYVFGSPIWILILVGLVISLLGMIGDLFESLLKRSAGVKDSSHLIPGHGGVLDRIDSWLFAAPVYYVFVRFIA